MFVVPAAAFAVTRRIRLGLRSIKRLPYGECVEVHQPLGRARLHTPTAHERLGEPVGHEPRRRAVAGPVRSGRGRTPGRSG